MYKHILAPTDGSEVAKKGVNQALALAKALNARVTIITVTERLLAYPGSYGNANLVNAVSIADLRADQDRSAGAVLDHAKHIADRQGVPAETLLVREAQPAEAISAAASSRDCDLIVIGSHGRRGLSRLLLGSKTAEVVAQSPVPVLVVSEPPEREHRSLGFSPEQLRHSREALGQGAARTVEPLSSQRHGARSTVRVRSNTNAALRANCV